MERLRSMAFRRTELARGLSFRLVNRRVSPLRRTDASNRPGEGGVCAGRLGLRDGWRAGLLPNRGQRLAVSASRRRSRRLEISLRATPPRTIAMTTTPPSKLACPELVKQMIAAMVPTRLRLMRATTSPGVLTPKYLLARPVMIPSRTTLWQRGEHRQAESLATSLNLKPVRRNGSCTYRRPTH